MATIRVLGIKTEANGTDGLQAMYWMLDGLGDLPMGWIPPNGYPDYADAWRSLPAGVDTKAPLSDFYPAELLDTLAGSVDTFRRWGVTQGQGDLVGATLGELPVPQAIAAMTSGSIDPQTAAAQADAAVTEIQGSLR